MRTQVAIIGAGPAGLLLGHLLHRRGIDTLILERHSRSYIERRIRAGVLEHDVAELFAAVGLGERMRREGLAHGGIHLRFAGQTVRIDFRSLVGRGILVYGQHELVKDLVRARLASGAPLWFEAEAVAVEGHCDGRPEVRVRRGDRIETVAAEVVAGCDGFHGIARAAVPSSLRREYQKQYPYAWLGILARAAPASDELIYACHERGFALLSMRSPTLSRLYIQVPPGTDLAAWPDERVWEELELRLSAPGFRLERGEVVQKDLTRMRSFVVEPMRWGRLVLAGDAAHIVPPTGAKGLNLAVADVTHLARALFAFFEEGREEGLEAYSRLCLERVWKVQHFSWWMTQMLHRAPDASPFDHRRQLGELAALSASRAAQAWLAENYTGLPLDVSGIVD